jgi:pyridoxamine 5'-phosphate oxidase
LDARVEELKAEYEGRPVPRPSWWGGLRVRPHLYEFWQNREDRLHDRLRYAPVPGGWRISRLQP